MNKLVRILLSIAFFAGVITSHGAVLFTDSFNRPNSNDLDAVTNGMGGLLLTNGTLTAGNVWLEPVDVAEANDTKSVINNNEVRVAVGAGTSHAVLNHNFATNVPAGNMSISLDVRAINPGNDASPIHRYLGIAIGFSLAEGNVSEDRLLSREADLFAAVTQNGRIRLNDGPEDSRGGPNGDVPADLEIDLSGGTDTFTAGVLRLELSFDNTLAGTVVTYDVFFNDVDVLAGTRTFTWSDSGELRIGMDGRASGSVVGDDFSVSGEAVVPPPVVFVGVDPDKVTATNTAQTVTLSWTNANLTPGSTYAITADRTVNYPGGGQTGNAFDGPASLEAVVDGTLGNTTFTIHISNSIPELVASNTATVTQIPPPGSQPNVIVILLDDMGWSDFSCYGSEIQTPTIDSLASNGLRYRNFYNTARCSTTRCALMTGLYTQQVAGNPGASLPDLITGNNLAIPELLSTTSYRSYMAGKWHLGTDGRSPISRGFEHVFGIRSGGSEPHASVSGGNQDSFWSQANHGFYSLNNEVAPISYSGTQFHQTDAIGDYSVAFINHHLSKGDGAPFFLYMPFNAVHWDINAYNDMADRYTDVADLTPDGVSTNGGLDGGDYYHYEVGWEQARADRFARQQALGVRDPNWVLSPKSPALNSNGTSSSTPPLVDIPDWNTLSADRRNDLARRMALYAAMLQQVDDNIKKVTDHLTTNGLFDNTLIFILADNGGNYEGGVFGKTAGTLNAAPVTGTTALRNMGQPGNPDLHIGGGWANVNNTPFRLYKHYQHEGGIRTPCIVHWPNGIKSPGRWIEDRAHLIDIMATISDATSTPYPASWPGRNLLPLEGESLVPHFDPATVDNFPDRPLGFEHEANRAWFSGKWKFVTKNFAYLDGSSPADELELYDLSVDPTELNNVALQHPLLLAQFIDEWNAWAQHVGVPANRLIVPPVPQVDPAPMSNDLLLDTFNRANGDDTDASANGISGSRVPPLGASSTYYEGYAPDRTDIEAITLRMAVTGAGMSENGIMHNFIGQDIIDSGGFSVQLRVDQINSTSTDPDRYGGFGVGLSQAEAAGGADINDTIPPLSFRGLAINGLGTADFFLELDIEGNLKAWIKGQLVATIPVGTAQGTILASFELGGFSTSDTVTVSAFFNGRLLDLDPLSAGTTVSFNWSTANANYIGLSARASEFVRMDNLAIRKLPLSYALASEYALAAGLSAPASALDANPDGDRDNNLVEWLKGGAPDTSDDERRLFMVRPSTADDFRFHLIRLVDAAKAGVNYDFEYSTNLVDWIDFTPDELSTQPDAPGYELVENRVPVGIAAGEPVIFVQMRALGPTQ